MSYDDYEDDGNVYKIVTYIMGHIWEEKDNMILSEARRYYKNNYSSNCALRLYVNGEPVPYIDANRVLKITIKYM